MRKLYNKWYENNKRRYFEDKTWEFAQGTLSVIGLAIRRGLLLIELHWQTQGRMWRGIKYPLIRRRGN